MAPDGTIWRPMTAITPSPVHARRQGALTIGVPRQAERRTWRPIRFTAARTPALSPQGDLYVPDASSMRAVTRTRRTATAPPSWGEPATDPGNFHIAHKSAATPRPGLRRRTREPSRPGLRRPRHVRDASGTTCTDRPACSWRACAQPPLLRGRDRRRHARHNEMPNVGAADQHLQSQGEMRRDSVNVGRASSGASSCRRTGSPSDSAATSTWARCRTPTGASPTRTRRPPAVFAVYQKARQGAATRGGAMTESDDVLPRPTTAASRRSGRALGRARCDARRRSDVRSLPPPGFESGRPSNIGNLKAGKAAIRHSRRVTGGRAWHGRASRIVTAVSDWHRWKTPARSSATIRTSRVSRKRAGTADDRRRASRIESGDPVALRSASSGRFVGAENVRGTQVMAYLLVSSRRTLTKLL